MSSPNRLCSAVAGTFSLSILFFFLSHSLSSTCTHAHALAAPSKSGLQPQCGYCTADIHCASGKCVQHHCVFETASSLALCISSPVLPECAECISKGQCVQGVCWGGRCTDGTQPSLNRCFAAPCAPCTSSLQCASKLCFAGRCAQAAGDGQKPRPCLHAASAPASKKNTKKPASSSGGNDDTEIPTLPAGPQQPPGDLKKKALCNVCEGDANCASGVCRSGVCVKRDHARALARCLRTECAECAGHAHCRSGFCLATKCVFRNDAESRGRCFPQRTFRPTCAACQQSLDCAAGVCDGGRCTDGTAAARRLCLAAECAECERDGQCRSGKCWRGKCIVSWRKRFDCGKGADDAKDKEGKERKEQKMEECSACRKDSDCKAGACVRGKCATVPEQVERRCFRVECARCERSRQCNGHRKCVRGRCTQHGEHGRQSCDGHTGGTGSAQHCQPCSHSKDCDSGLCFGYKCVVRSFDSMRECFGDGSMLGKLM